MDPIIKKFLDNPSKVLRNYRKSNSDWCYSKKHKTCIHSPKCSIRKYRNLFYDKKEWYPISIEEINTKTEQEKIDKTNDIDPFDFKSAISRNIFILEKTKKDYISLYNNLNQKGIWEKIDDPVLFLKSCSENYSFSTVGTSCKIILSYLKCLDPKEKIKVFGKVKGKRIFRDYHIYLKIIQDYLQTKVETEHFNTEDIYNDIISGIKNCKVDQELLLMKLYMFYNCLRTDYNTVKLINFDEENDNYFKNNTIVFNTLKKNNNQLKIKLSDEIVNHIKTTEFLFETSQHKQFTSKNFSKYIKTVFSKNSKNSNTNLNTIRKIVATHQRITIILPNESKEIAKKMNHSEYMSKYYYNQKT